MNILSLLFLMLPHFMVNNSLEINFGTEKEVANWYPILDGVMGGLSTGKMETRENSVVFTGAISLENNGGFASLRGPFQKQIYPTTAK